MSCVDLLCYALPVALQCYAAADIQREADANEVHAGMPTSLFCGALGILRRRERREPWQEPTKQRGEPFRAGRAVSRSSEVYEHLLLFGKQA